VKKLKPSYLWAVVFIALLCLQGCENFDTERCLQTVQEKYPDAKEIKLLPGANYEFMVNTGKEIRFVRVMGKHTEITSDTVYMKFE
jgi:hypothetical protein